MRLRRRNNPKATAESFQRGYYSFGDIGMIDKDGFLYLLDRSKDVGCCDPTA